MGKALGIDYGTKRTGIAITDAMQIIASGLTTVATHTLDDFIADIIIKENIKETMLEKFKPYDLDPSTGTMALQYILDTKKYNFQIELFVIFYLIYRLLIFIEILARCKKHIMTQQI